MSHVIDWVSPSLPVDPIADKSPFYNTPPASVGTFIASQDNPIVLDTSGGTGYGNSQGANWVYALVFAAKITLPRLRLPSGAFDMGWAVKGLADVARQPNYSWGNAAAYIDSAANVNAALSAAVLVAGQALNLPGMLRARPGLGATIRDSYGWPLGTSAFGEGFDGWGAGSGFGSVADAGRTLLVTCYVILSRPNGGDVFDPGPFDAGYRPIVTASHSYDYTPPPPSPYVVGGAHSTGVVPK